MTNKDLFNGLNHIDEDIINEAMPGQEASDLSVKIYNNKNIRRKKWINSVHSLTTVAALLAVAILGTEVYRLNNRVVELETTGAAVGNSTDSSSSIANSIFTGIKSSSEFGKYEVAANYGNFYDTIKAVEEEYSSKGGFLNYGADLMENVEESIADFGAASGAMKGEATDSIAEADFSTTNVMTQGVDESDIVKTDGNYIYMVESGQISITDIRQGKPGEETLLRPKFESPSDEIEEMFVSDGKLLLIVNHCEGDNETICYSYDIADPTNPELIGTARQDGFYKTSRKIGNTVYVFSNEYVGTADLKKAKALREENLSKWVPQVNNKVIACDCIYIDEETLDGTIISSFDIEKPEVTIDAKYVMNGADEIYVSNDAIYFYSREWTKSRTITSISKMYFEDGVMEAGESTSVRGFLNDDFAINQHNGYLYVLATEDDSRVEVNTLHVFDKDMEEVGVINEIARDELIYAARFVGDYAYFITYKQTDPLFVADISDPTNPKLLGELEVSGFSEYLHMWDDTHILGIGYGDSSRDTIKVTMFDVSDPCKPVEEDYITIDDYGYYCEGMYNYKAILADPAKNLIGFAADKYYLLNYDENEGFEIIEEENIKYDNSDGYRGLYSGNDFYVAGNSEIKHIAIGDGD